MPVEPTDVFGAFHDPYILLRAKALKEFAFGHAIIQYDVYGRIMELVDIPAAEFDFF